MIHSMTGFGQAVQTAAEWRCTVELRSVNGRHLDLRLRLPSGLMHMDEPLKKRIRDRCERGKMDGTVTLTPEDASRSIMSVNRPLLQGYRVILEQISQVLGQPVQVSLNDLLSNRDLVYQPSWENQTEEIEALVLATLDEALERLLAMRETEGGALQAALQTHADAMRRMVGQVAPLTADLPAHYAKRLRESLAKLVNGGPLPGEERILQEIALFADRCDVTEELARLNTHLEHLDQLLQQGGSVGRRLEFLLQELNRETNTLGVKASDVAVSAITVEMKAEIEKLREQVLNIE